jgi:hypothetical protein
VVAIPSGVFYCLLYFLSRVIPEMEPGRNHEMKKSERIAHARRLRRGAEILVHDMEFAPFDPMYPNSGGRYGICSTIESAFRAGHKTTALLGDIHEEELGQFWFDSKSDENQNARALLCLLTAEALERGDLEVA